MDGLTSQGKVSRVNVLRGLSENEEIQRGWNRGREERRMGGMLEQRDEGTN